MGFQLPTSTGERRISEPSTSKVSKIRKPFFQRSQQRLVKFATHFVRPVFIGAITPFTIQI